MSDLRERVARAIHDVWRKLNSVGDDIANYATWEEIENWERVQILSEADAAIALVLEEAAKVARAVGDDVIAKAAPKDAQPHILATAMDCAAAIRALKEKSDD